MKWSAGIFIGIIGLLLTAVPLLADAAVRDLSPIEYATTLDLFMKGRTAEADARLLALADSCAGQPLYLLARARVHLEYIPFDDDDKELTKELSVPALDLLDEVITNCDDGLDEGGDEFRVLQLRFYRGWAWMMKSQIKALGRNFYSAGRDAGKGKGDLEKYLAARPDEAIPNGLLGAYLYFTDAVPKLFQFLSKLFSVPTGDRDRGLELIGRSASLDSPARVDYELLQANVTFFFEGRYEEGLGMLGGLMDRYPRYPRLALGDAMIGPLDPLNGGSRLATASATVNRLVDEPGIDTASLWTVRAFRAWTLRFRAGHETARSAFGDLLDDAPAHPDWIQGFARIQLAEIEAAASRPEAARDLAELILADDRNDRFHDQAKGLLKDLEKFSVALAPFDDSLVAALYSAGPEALLRITEDLDPVANSSIRAAFYAAECRLLAGDPGAAARGFRAAHAMDVLAWDEPYRMLAAARVGELSALSGNFRTAANWLGRAAEIHRNIYRLDWLLQGRQRYYEELEENRQYGPPPTLLAPAP